MVWQLCLNYFFNNYKTDKIVRLRSATLRTPHCLMQFAVLGYIVGYQLCYKMLVFETEPPESHVRLALRPPLHNFWECSDEEFTCEQNLAPLKDLQYCAKDKLPPGVDCSYFDFHEAMPSADLVATMVTTAEQRRSSTSAIEKHKAEIWESYNVSRTYVADIEEHTVLIKHSFHSRAYDEVLDQANTQGFLAFQGDPHHPRNIPCMSSNCNYTSLDWNNSKWYPNCSRNPSQRHGPTNGDTCFSGEDGDHVSLKMLLEAANFTLDDVVWKNAKTRDVMGKTAPSEPRASQFNVTKRFAGSALELDIHYMNNDPWEYWNFWYGAFWKGSSWHRPKGCWLFYPQPRVKYIYSVKPVHFGSHQKTEFSHLVQEHAHKRTLVRVNGVLIFVRTRGSLGDLSFLHTLLTLAVTASLFKICNYMVDKVLVRIYRFCPCPADFRHAAVLHRVVWEDYAEHTDASEATEGAGLVKNLEEAKQKQADRMLRKYAPKDHQGKTYLPVNG